MELILIELDQYEIVISNIIVTHINIHKEVLNYFKQNNFKIYVVSVIYDVIPNKYSLDLSLSDLDSIIIEWLSGLSLFDQDNSYNEIEPSKFEERVCHDLEDIIKIEFPNKCVTSAISNIKNISHFLDTIYTQDREHVRELHSAYHNTNITPIRRVNIKI